VFEAQGRDVVELFNRLSSNDLRPIAGGQAVSTLFLSPEGRVLFRVLLLPGEPLRAVAEPPAREALPAWIDTYTFGEDARLVLEPSLAAAIVLGPDALARAPHVLGGDGAVASGDGVTWARRDLGPLEAAILTGSSHALDAELSRLALPLLDDASWTQLRVETAEPAAGRELTQARFPLEAGLDREVSFTKGCYTGQEVVARQDSRGKVLRRLVALSFDERPPDGEAIDGEGREGCAITTIAPAPSRERDGSRVPVAALAYVSSRQAMPGTRVVTTSGLAARVLELPLLPAE
jgi:folate-binding protein YgfZ